MPGQQLWRDKAKQHGVEKACQPPQSTSQGERPQLVAKGEVAQRLHSVFVALDANQHPAKRRLQHAPQEQVHQHQRGQNEVEQMHFIAQLKRLPAKNGCRGFGVEVHPVRAAAQRRIVEDEVRHLGKSQRHHDEVDAFGAQHEQANQKRRQRCQRHRGWQHQPQAHGFKLRHEQRHRVGRNTEVRRMAEADQTGKAHQQIQAHGKNSHDQNLADDLDVERLTRQRDAGDDCQGDQFEDQRSVCVHGLSLFSGCLRGATAKPPPSPRTPRCPRVPGSAPCRRCRQSPRSGPQSAHPTPSQYHRSPR